MARRVFLHIGLPKTGTTYLQQILWEARRPLRADGLLLPGAGHREHLWAALDLQQRPRLARRHPDAPGAWSRLVAETAGWRQDALITHEFMCGATRAQAAAAVAALGEAEVHVVITARDTLGMLTAGWQESVKNGGRRTLEEVAAHTARGAGSEFGWRTWDLGKVLRRWGGHVPPERLHILPMPDRSTSRPDAHWRNFAGVLGLDPDRHRAPEGAVNARIGHEQIELLRRVNERLDGFDTSLDRGEWIRGYLAEGRLAQQRGGPILAPPDLVEDCRRRAGRAVRMIEEAGYDVRGDVAALLVPGDAPTTSDGVGEPRHDVPDSRLVDAAATLVAVMLQDVRDLSRESRPPR